MSGRMAVERNPLWRAMLLYGSYEEPLRYSNVHVFAEQEIDCQAMLIDGAIEVGPSPSDSDISLVHSPRCADRSSISLPPLLELRDVALNPSEDRCMRDIDTALGHHLHQVTVAKFVVDVPSNTENDDCAIEVAATEER
jgi:hypothetical protein